MRKHVTRRPVPWKTWFSSKTEVRCGCPSYDSASMAHPVTFCRYRKLRPVSHPVTSHSFVGMAREGPPCPLRENVAIKKEKQKKEKEKTKQNLRKPGNKSVHDSMRTWLHSALSGPAGYQGLSHVQQNYTDMPQRGDNMVPSSQTRTDSEGKRSIHAFFCNARLCCSNE